MLAVTAAVFDFDATISGTFVTDGGAPVANVHLDHLSVTATPFSFTSLIVDQTVSFLDNPGELLASGPLLFTGGTGVFAGASGSGDVEAIIQFMRMDQGGHAQGRQKRSHPVA